MRGDYNIQKRSNTQENGDKEETGSSSHAHLPSVPATQVILSNFLPLQTLL